MPHNKRHLLHDDSKTVKTFKLLGLNVNLGLEDKITHCLQCFIHVLFCDDCESISTLQVMF